MRLLVKAISTIHLSMIPLLLCFSRTLITKYIYSCKSILAPQHIYLVIVTYRLQPHQLAVLAHPPTSYTPKNVDHGRCYHITAPRPPFSRPRKPFSVEGTFGVRRPHLLRRPRPRWRPWTRLPGISLNNVNVKHRYR